MARPKLADGKRVTICVKVSEAEAAVIDTARGNLTRSAYLRSLATRGPARSGRAAEPLLEPAREPSARAACKHPGVPRKTLCRRCGKYNV